MLMGILPVSAQTPNRVECMVPTFTMIGSGGH